MGYPIGSELAGDVEVGVLELTGIDPLTRTVRHKGIPSGIVSGMQLPLKGDEALAVALHLIMPSLRGGGKGVLGGGLRVVSSLFLFEQRGVLGSCGAGGAEGVDGDESEAAPNAAETDAVG